MLQRCRRLLGRLLLRRLLAGVFVLVVFLRKHARSCEKAGEGEHQCQGTKTHGTSCRSMDPPAQGSAPDCRTSAWRKSVMMALSKGKVKESSAPPGCGRSSPPARGAD